MAPSLFGGAGAGFATRFDADGSVRASLRELRSARNELDLREVALAVLVAYRIVVTQSDEAASGRFLTDESVRGLRDKSCGLETILPRGCAENNRKKKQ